MKIEIDVNEKDLLELVATKIVDKMFDGMKQQMQSATELMLKNKISSYLDSLLKEGAKSKLDKIIDLLEIKLKKTKD